VSFLCSDPNGPALCPETGVSRTGAGGPRRAAEARAAAREWLARTARWQGEGVWESGAADTTLVGSRLGWDETAGGLRDVDGPGALIPAWTLLARRGNGGRDSADGGGVDAADVEAVVARRPGGRGRGPGPCHGAPVCPAWLGGVGVGGAAAHPRPLVLACWFGRADVVRTLLRLGACPNARCARGRTPLCYAAAADCPGAIVALLDAGADLEAADSRGRRPLHWAALTGSARAAQALLARGAKPHPRCLGPDETPGHTPLHLACWDPGRHCSDGRRARPRDERDVPALPAQLLVRCPLDASGLDRAPEEGARGMGRGGAVARGAAPGPGGGGVRGPPGGGAVGAALERVLAAGGRDGPVPDLPHGPPRRGSVAALILALLDGGSDPNLKAGTAGLTVPRLAAALGARAAATALAAPGQAEQCVADADACHAAGRLDEAASCYTLALRETEALRRHGLDAAGRAALAAPAGGGGPRRRPPGPVSRVAAAAFAGRAAVRATRGETDADAAAALADADEALAIDPDHRGARRVRDRGGRPGTGAGAGARRGGAGGVASCLSPAEAAAAKESKAEKRRRQKAERRAAEGALAAAQAEAVRGAAAEAAGRDWPAAAAAAAAAAVARAAEAAPAPAVAALGGADAAAGVAAAAARARNGDGGGEGGRTEAPTAPASPTVPSASAPAAPTPEAADPAVPVDGPSPLRVALSATSSSAAPTGSAAAPAERPGVPPLSVTPPPTPADLAAAPAAGNPGDNETTTRRVPGTDPPRDNLKKNTQAVLRRAALERIAALEAELSEIAARRAAAAAAK